MRAADIILAGVVLIDILGYKEISQSVYGYTIIFWMFFGDDGSRNVKVDPIKKRFFKGNIK